MEEAKTTINKNNFLFEYFDKSPGSQGIDNEEERLLVFSQRLRET